jgi:coenzyme F420-0:L-glutamate ligase / coenzyme F420-1:gamma-L-glutamate ligase
MSLPAAVRCADRLELIALPGIPVVQPGDDIGALVCDALERADLCPKTGDDVLVVTSKVASRAEDRFVDLSAVDASARALELAERTQKDARLVELILREASEVSRIATGVVVVRHRLGFISANAGIDESNGRPQTDQRGPWVLLLPRDPDASAARIRAAVMRRYNADIAVVLSDSHGRPFRLGTVGVAIGISGLPALWDQRGGHDLHGRELKATITGLADQVAAAADLVAGQAAEGRAAVLVRGLSYELQPHSAALDLIRPSSQDLYA